MYSFDSRVRYSEVAEDRKCSIVSIINYFQDCCAYESDDKGVGLDWMEEHHTAWMLTGWHIQILKRPVYCQEIKINTWACGFKFFLGKRNFTIEDKATGELLVAAYSDWAYVNVDTGMPARELPQKEIDAYGMQEPLDRDFEKGKIQVPSEQMRDGREILVTEANLDPHHHVNNAQYISLALMALEGEIDNVDEIKGIRAEYKQQALLGETLYSKVSERISDRYTVVLSDSEGKVKLNSQFIVNSVS